MAAPILSREDIEQIAGRVLSIYTEAYVPERHAKLLSFSCFFHSRKFLLVFWYMEIKSGEVSVV